MTASDDDPVVVVGAGLAGLVAALRLGQAGRRVVVLAKGNGSIPLSGATIDVLGYAPERVAHPHEAWAGFVAAHTDHPYARLSLDAVAESLTWFKAQADGVRYVGDLGRNFLLPTALGGLKPSAVVPQTMAGGDLSGGGRVAVVGWPALKDFHAHLAAANLSRGRGEGGAITARAVEIDVPTRGEADPGSLRLARWFDEPEYRAEVVRRLAPHLEDDEIVAMPAVLGLDSSERAWEELEAVLERPVFEIPTLPPSVPGLRLFRTLKARLRAAGTRMVVGSAVASVETDGRRAVAVHAQTAGRTRRVAASAVVLATGGWASGGLELDPSWRVRETVLGLPVAGVPAAGEPRFLPGYLDSHPLARAGIAVDESFSPVDGDGTVVYDNVYAAGALLAGAEPWREKSGDGLSLATGYRAAGSILERQA